jgi:hypothetical protein
MLSKSWLPFIDTFGHSEAETAAAMLVAAMACHGDVWAPMLPAELGAWMKAEAANPEGRWAKLFDNPFLRPDFGELVSEGWARWVGDEAEGRKRPLELTDKALVRIVEKGWVV